MENIYRYIDDNRDRFLEELFTFLRQPSISTQDVGVKECAELLRGMLEKIGVKAKIMETSRHPVVLGEVRNPDAKNTLLIYGHYDVQPPEPLDLWESSPFDPEVRNGRIYGRGTADNKGQLFSHIKAMESILTVKGAASTNVVFLFEGEEEISSPNLRPFIESHRDLLKADACLVSDGPKHESGRPTIVCGLKGMLYVELRAKAANSDLHSMRAAAVPSGAWKLVRALQTLKDKDDHILIPGFYDSVREPTPAELEVTKKVPLDAASIRNELDVDYLIGGDDAYYDNIFFSPTCNLAGINSGYTGPGAKTVLPCQGFAKIDFRLVPDQTPEETLRLLRSHLDEQGFEDIEIVQHGELMPSRTSVEHPYVKLVCSAVKEAVQEEPLVFPGMGGSGPDYLFTGVLGLPSIWLPFAPHDSSNHAPNENIMLEGFFDGIKMGASIIERMSEL